MTEPIPPTPPQDPFAAGVPHADVYGDAPAGYPLPYSMPMQTRDRPGLITSIGVISIVVACLTCLTSMFSGCESAGLYMVAKMSKTRIAATAAATTPVAPSATPDTAPSDAEVANPIGLNSADRAVMVSTLNAMQPLSDARRRQLDRLLAEQGQRILPTAGIPLTAGRVKTSISASNTLAGDGDNPGNTVFVTAWGTLNVYDAKAEFKSAETGQVISTAVEIPTAADATTQPANIQIAPTASQSARIVLTAAEIQGAMQKVQTQIGKPLTPAQSASLKKMLEDPNQSYILPGTQWSPVRAAGGAADGSIWVVFTGQYLAMDANGVANAAFTGSSAGPVFNISGAACTLCILDALLSIGLAIFLFASAIVVLRQSPTGRKLHLIYAGIKIPLVIFGGLSLYWMVSQFMASIAASTPGGGAGGTAAATAMWIGFLSILALIYPIALLIVLNTKGMRDYYLATPA